MAILDPATLSRLLNQPDLLAGADELYLTQVIADAQSQIAGFLGYDPVLQVVSNEDGIVTYVQSGSYVGRYALQLAVSPLIPGPASVIFSDLELTYGLSTLPNAAVSLATVTVLHSTGQAFTLAPGAVEALTWQYGLTPGVQAVGYIASYVAGYATGINDPTLPGNVSYGAPPMPAAITTAAVLLCRERLATDAGSNANTSNAASGAVTYIRTADSEIKYQTSSSSSSKIAGSPLGYGTAMADAAATRLQPWRRMLTPLLI